MNLHARVAIAVAALLRFAPVLEAAEGPRPIEKFEDLRFRSIGPAVRGGRIDVVAVQENRPSVLYVGAASGGVWKSVNQGTTCQPIFDDHETSSIGDVAISPSDPEIVWVGTGEPNNRQSSSFGFGVYRSEDGGATFQHVGLEGTGHISRSPSLAAQARDLFGEIEGTDVQQGTLHGPTPVQNERLGRLERRSDEALRNLEEVMKASLAELNSKLEALGPIRIEP
jgi:hypothetical protein